jgi:putative peptidoglycan lipid II flippase
VIAILEAVLWAARGVTSESWHEIIDLTLWMTPGLFFICLYGLNAALLQCQKKYFLPAVAPVAFNFIWISVVLFLPGVKWLAIGVTLSFAGQWIMTFFEGAKMLPLKEWLTPRLFSPEFQKLLKPLGLGIVGIGAVQFNSALDAIFARIADPEGPAYLWYAIRLQQLPLALFGIALSGALLPPLSRTEDPIRRQELLQSALKYSGTLMLVCTFGILAVGIPSINLLYGHGDFSPHAVQQTGYCLWAYGAGLVPSVFVLVLSASFYAEKNYRMPAFASLLSVLANVALNALFVFGFKWGAISIAVATSLSSLLNGILLSKEVRWSPFFLKMMCAAALPAVGCLWINSFFGLPRDLFSQGVQFGTLSLLYFGSVFLLSWWFQLTERVL